MILVSQRKRGKTSTFLTPNEGELTSAETSALARASLTFRRPIVPIWDFVLRISDFVRRIAFSQLTDCAGRAPSRRGEVLRLQRLPAAQCEVSPEPTEFSSAIEPKTYVKFARRAI